MIRYHEIEFHVLHLSEVHLVCEMSFAFEYILVTFYLSKHILCRKKKD